MRLYPSCVLSKPFHGQQAIFWPTPNYLSNFIFYYSPFFSLLTKNTGLLTIPYNEHIFPSY